MEINQGVNEEDAVWGHITGTIANQTDLFTNFIKLDQTTPQTTIGRFTFPALTVDTNTLYVDETNHRIGIGDINPQRKVEIADNTDASLYLRRSSTATDAYSELLFGVSTADVYNNSIRSIRQSSGLSDLAIFSNTTGSAYNTLFETLRIKNTTGYVGIGTTAPDNLLDVSKSVSGAVGGIMQITNPAVSAAGNAVELRFAPSDSHTVRYASIQGINRDGSNNIELALLTGSGGSITEKMRVNSTGNVGIGTNNPFTKLEVSNTGAGVTEGLSMSNYTTPAANIGSELSFYGGTGQRISSIFGAWSGAATTDGYLAFRTRNANVLTEQMRINNLGYVGIGTSSPAAKLDVNGDSYLRGVNYIVSSLGGVTIKPSQNNSSKINSTSFLALQDESTRLVGVGYTSDSIPGGYTAKLWVNGGIYNSTNFYNIGTGYFGGSVGINTTNPTNKLDVRGTASTDSIRSAIGFDIYPVPNPTNLSGVAVAGSGLEIGDYYYLITYTTALGETNSFLANKITTTAGNQSVTLTIPVSTDPRVTGRKIYRSKVNSFGYLDYVLATVANNTDTTYTDTTPDASLAGSAGASYFRMNTTSNQITVGGVRSMIIDTNNTAFGYLAGGSITAGGRSALFGYGAGRAITTGNSHAYFGDRAGWNTTTGAHNVGINYQALFNNTTGSYNIGIGTNSLLNNATGSNDIAIGFYTLAGVSGNNHSNNVSVGNYSGYSITTGQYNTFLAHQAGYNITTGSYNLYSGYNAGRFIADGATANQTSSFGVYLGTETKASADGVNNEIVIGYNAIGKGSNTVTIGNTSILANYFSGQLIPGKISSAPTAIEGGIYFNTTDKHFYGYNGTDWKQLDN